MKESSGITPQYREWATIVVRNLRERPTSPVQCSNMVLALHNALQLADYHANDIGIDAQGFWADSDNHTLLLPWGEKAVLITKHPPYAQRGLLPRPHSYLVEGNQEHE